jgi:hypothetical protein
MLESFFFVRDFLKKQVQGLAVNRFPGAFLMICALSSCLALEDFIQAEFAVTRCTVFFSKRGDFPTILGRSIFFFLRF